MDSGFYKKWIGKFISIVRNYPRESIFKRFKHMNHLISEKLFVFRTNETDKNKSGDAFDHRDIKAVMLLRLGHSAKSSFPCPNGCFLSTIIKSLMNRNLIRDQRKFMIQIKPEFALTMLTTQIINNNRVVSSLTANKLINEFMTKHRNMFSFIKTCYLFRIPLFFSKFIKNAFSHLKRSKLKMRLSALSYLTEMIRSIRVIDIAIRKGISLKFLIDNSSHIQVQLIRNEIHRKMNAAQSCNFLPFHLFNRKSRLYFLFMTTQR